MVAAGLVSTCYRYSVALLGFGGGGMLRYFFGCGELGPWRIADANQFSLFVGAVAFSLYFYSFIQTIFP